MIVTARQIEEAVKSGRPVVLPYRARLSPLARDLVRSKKIQVGYADVDLDGKPNPDAAPAARALWWADESCGPCKAALMMAAREAGVETMEIGVDRLREIEMVKLLAREIGGGRSQSGVVFVRNAARMMVYLNRCPSLRAILGTCLDSVDQGIQQVGANVLVLEHPYQTLATAKSLIGKFIRSKRQLSEDVKKRLRELASCG